MKIYAEPAISRKSTLLILKIVLTDGEKYDKVLNVVRGTRPRSIQSINNIMFASYECKYGRRKMANRIRREICCFTLDTEKRISTEPCRLEVRNG